MKKQVLAVFDGVTGVYFQPFFAVNTAAGIRDFISACRNGEAQNASDLVLMHIGEFDDEGGWLHSSVPTRLQGGAAALITSKVESE